ncbi:unnamed protein product [Protopolystoma xenopodis]|uniref:Uncharacterized protein n=1 Tax=Protopolystoma xenopodis TaxID=117903 RepID=A0A448XP68_9PLAT|nr:unnamed protein product [Protopolystoma xenopodis]
MQGLAILGHHWQATLAKSKELELGEEYGEQEPSTRYELTNKVIGRPVDNTVASLWHRRNHSVAEKYPEVN